MKKPCSIRTCLNTVLASYTVFGIHENDSIIRLEGCSCGTNLDARRIGTLIAQLGDKKAPEHSFFQNTLLESIHTTVWTVDKDLSIIKHDVSLHPSPEVKGKFRNCILLLTGIRTPSAPNAFVYSNSHPPGMGFRIIAIFENRSLFFVFFLRAQKTRAG
jgi:hypothetical protein